MDENVERVLRIAQKHQMMQSMELCCSAEHPCDMVVLFNEIKRLNGEIAGLNKGTLALVEALAVTRQVDR
jgi:hypothetical protein